MKLRLLCASTFVLLITIGGWAADSYYVYDGNNLYTVFDSPQNAHYDQWAVFYFKRGASVTVLSQRWGMGLEDSPSAVLRSIEKNQQFEKRYEKWCACSWGPNTFFNPAAPVAMTKRAAVMNPRQLEILSKLHTGWDRIDALIGRFNTAATLAGEAKLPRLRYKGPFSEYMDAMHSAIDQFMSINHELTQYSDAALNSLQSQLDKFMDDTNHAMRVSDEGLRVLTDRFSAWTPATMVSNQATASVRGQYQIPCVANPDCQTALPGSRCIATRCQLPSIIQSTVEYRWETSGIAKCAIEFRSANQSLPTNPLSLAAAVVTDAGSREGASVTLWAASPGLATDSVDNCSEVKSVTITEMDSIPPIYVGVRPLYHGQVRDTSATLGGIGTIDISSGRLIAKFPPHQSDFTPNCATCPFVPERPDPAWSFSVGIRDLRNIGDGAVVECRNWRDGYSILLDCKDNKPCFNVDGNVVVNDLVFLSEAQCKGVAAAIYKEVRRK